MRVRILTPSTGILNGVSLSCLFPGLTYELPVSLGTFLIGSGAAEELAHQTQALVMPLGARTSFHQILHGRTHVPPDDRAADTSRRGRVRKKR